MANFIVYFCCVMEIASVIWDTIPLWLKTLLSFVLVGCLIAMEIIEDRTNSRITKLERELAELKERGGEK